MSITYLTQEDYNKLSKELLALKTSERQKIALAIGEAREKGDLSENAEYDAAKEAQGLLELKISNMETKIATAKIISKDQIDSSRVAILCKVKILNVTSKKDYYYEIVSEPAADIKTNKISVSSPIAKGLLGKSVGEIASVTTPRGILKFEILDISI